MKKAGNLKFWTATVILILIAVFSTAGTVRSMEGPDRGEQEDYYSRLEEQLVKDTRTCLDERGFLHSGVMLTRVVDSDGSREYTLTVHHRDISRMTAGSREELATALADLFSEEEACGFRYEFFFTED